MWRGGPELFLRRTAAWLPQFGWEPRLVLAGAPYEPLFDIAAYPAKVIVTRTAYNYPTLIRRTAREIARFNPEVIVGSPTPSAGIVLRALYSRGASQARFVDVIHSDTNGAYEIVENRADVSAAVAGVSDAIVRRASSSAKLRGRVRRIYYPIPFPESVPDRSARSGPLRLVWVGFVQQRWKRVLDLPLLVRELMANKIDFTLDIFGDGPERPKVEAGMRETADASERVQFHGNKPNREVMAKLPEYDVFLLVSDTEGQSLAMMEGMAHGLVPVVTDLTGARELIEHGRNGYLLPVGGFSEFARTLALLAQDRTLLHNVGTAARQAIAAHNAEPAAVKHFADFLSEAATLPLPDADGIKTPFFPQCRMDRLHVPHFLQSLRRWRAKQWLD